MKIYLRTRGKQEDYQWINADGLNGTPEEWWGNNFKDLSRFEKPTVIVTRNNQSLKILITAITSKRKDELSGTLLRNSIDMVFEDLSSVPQEIRKSLFMIVFSRLCNIKNICEGADSLKSCFSEYFDEILPEDLIESIFAGTFNGKIKIDVKDLAMRCDTLPVTGGERKIELTEDNFYFCNIKFDKTLSVVGKFLYEVIVGSTEATVVFGNLLNKVESLKGVKANLKKTLLLAYLSSGIEEKSIISFKYNKPSDENSEGNQYLYSSTEMKYCGLICFVLGVLIGVGIMTISFYTNLLH